ncbi:MAG: pyridoxamine 5'-phosphate oxidase family protein [Myxococcaceae bacterium]
MDKVAPSARTRVQRLPARAAYDADTIAAILDEGLLCYLGFVADGQPFVLPTTYVRLGNHLYVHGSAASRMLKTLATGVDACVTVTLLDGLVLARSAFHHSMNYRSVVILGRARAVTDVEEKRRVLAALVEHILTGRSGQVREPSDKELTATLVLALPLTEASGKIRRGPPLDDEADYASDCWAGVLPLQLQPLPPIRDPRLPAEIQAPESLARYRRGLSTD